MSEKSLLAGLLLIALASCTPIRQDARPQPAPAPEVPPEPSVVEEPAKTGPVKAGLLLPLTGQASAVGQDLLNASLMALFDVGTTDLELLPADTGGSPEGARAAAQQVLAEDAELIIGPLFASSASAVAPLAREAGVPVLSFSNDNSIAGNGVFAMGYGPEDQIRRVISFAQSQGFNRIAAVGPDDAYGSRALAAWRNEVSGPNGQLYVPDANGMADTIRQVARYDQRKAERDRQFEALQGAADQASLSRLAQLETLDTIGDPPFDALLIADGSTRLRSASALLTFYDVDPKTVKLLGTMFWEQDRRVLADSELAGAWYATVAPGQQSRFAERFLANYGTRPNLIAGLGYDATAMAVVLSQQDRSFPTSLLTDPSGFVGQSGIFRLRPDGTAEHGLAVVEVRNGNPEVVSPAPTDFGAAALTQ